MKEKKKEKKTRKIPEVPDLPSKETQPVNPRIPSTIAFMSGQRCCFLVWCACVTQQSKHCHLPTNGEKKKTSMQLGRYVQC